MRRLLCCLCLAGSVSVVLAGCGPSVPDVPQGSNEPPALDDRAELKQRLEAIAESGYGGSGLAGLREGLQKLDQALLTDLDALEKAESQGDTNKVKQIAKEMAGKL